jgi:RNA polymerase sigma factor (sigma-70 family)
MTDRAKAESTAEPPVAPAPPARISRGVAIVLFLALGAFFVEAIVRLVMTGAFVIALLVGAVEAPFLKSMGALSKDQFNATLVAGLVLPMLGALVGGGWRLLRWTGARYFGTKPLPPWRPTWVTILTLVLLGFLGVVLLPFDQAHAISADGVVGGGLLGASIFLIWLGAWGVVRIGWWGTSGMWRACQTRPVLSGMTIVAAGSAALLAWTADNVLAAMIRQAPPKASRSFEPDTYGDPGEAFRQGLSILADAESAAIASAPLGAPSKGPPTLPVSAASATSSDSAFLSAFGAGGDDPFNDCIESLHAEPPAPSAITEAKAAFDEDLVQDTAIQVCLHERKKRANNLRPYFFKALANSRLAHDSRASRCTVVDIIDCRLAGPEDAAIAAEHRSVERMLCDLTEQQRAVVVLSVFHDMKGPEIARTLGISEAAARQTLSTTLRKLREQYDERCN